MLFSIFHTYFRDSKRTSHTSITIICAVLNWSYFVVSSRADHTSMNIVYRSNLDHVLHYFDTRVTPSAECPFKGRAVQGCNISMENLQRFILEKTIQPKGFNHALTKKK